MGTEGHKSVIFVIVLSKRETVNNSGLRLSDRGKCFDGTKDIGQISKSLDVIVSFFGDGFRVVDRSDTGANLCASCAICPILFVKHDRPIVVGEKLRSLTDENSLSSSGVSWDRQVASSIRAVRLLSA